MQSDRNAEPAREFSRQCQLRLIERTHLASAAQLAGPVDVICLNFDHPDIEGLQFAAATKTQFPSIPILMLISQQSTDIVLWALRSRMFDVLIKPVTAQEILRVTERLAPIIAAKRTQSTRTNVATCSVLPDEARFRMRDHARHKLAAVMDYINKNYSRAISEAEMAKMCGMTAFRFSRGFRETYGVTFRDYLADCRLKHAQRLLANPEIPVTDVASMVGFNDPSYFARLFRKRLRSSPTSYRASVLAASAQSAAKDTDEDANLHQA